LKKIRKTVFCFVLLLLTAVILNFASQFIIHMLYPLKYEDSIRYYAEKNNLDPYFVMAVIKAESNFDPSASSGVAGGLMQITDDTAKWIADKIGFELDESDIENPEINIKMGCYYLNYLSSLYSDRDVILACYNAGMGNVSKWLKDSRYSDDGKTLDSIPFEETKTYIEKVNKYESIYYKLYNDKKKG